MQELRVCHSQRALEPSIAVPIGLDADRVAQVVKELDDPLHLRRSHSGFADEANHLPADIEFESQVTGKRGPMQVTFEGNTAWVIALTEYDGKFEGDPVNFVSAQLVVLTRDSGNWRIRSIHWSSRRA